MWNVPHLTYSKLITVANFFNQNRLYIYIWRDITNINLWISVLYVLFFSLDLVKRKGLILVNLIMCMKLCEKSEEPSSYKLEIFSRVKWFRSCCVTIRNCPSVYEGTGYASTWLNATKLRVQILYNYSSFIKQENLLIYYLSENCHHHLRRRKFRKFWHFTLPLNYNKIKSNMFKDQRFYAIIKGYYSTGKLLKWQTNFMQYSLDDNDHIWKID